jgi:hypothetical protein
MSAYQEYAIALSVREGKTVSVAEAVRMVLERAMKSRERKK